MQNLIRTKKIVEKKGSHTAIHDLASKFQRQLDRDMYYWLQLSVMLFSVIKCMYVNISRSYTMVLNEILLKLHTYTS